MQNYPTSMRPIDCVSNTASAGSSGPIAKCSIIIRAYNEAQHIGKLLYGLKSQDHPIHEIILVDSGSTDGTVAIAQDQGAAILTIDREEFSFGRSLNLGCRHATGDILVFASAHVYPLHRSWLRKLITPLRDTRYVLSYGRQTGNHINKFSEHQIFAQWFPEVSAIPQPHHFCNNANCAIRRSTWEQLPYDETLTGLEDLAWAKKAQRRGGLIAYVAEASIVHVHDETYAHIRNRYRREAMALRFIQPGMRFGFLDFVHLFLTNTMSDCIAAYRQHRLSREWRSIVLFRFNQFYGTLKGHRGPCNITSSLRQRFYFPQRQDKRPTIGEYSQDSDLIDYETIDSPESSSVHPSRRRA